MWYAWVNYRGTFADYYDLLYGSLEEIANELINNGNGIIEIEQITKEDYEGTWYEQSFKNFFKFRSKKMHTAKMIGAYYFEYCDYVTSVEFVANGYSELVRKFNEYSDEYQYRFYMRDNIEETMENMSEIDCMLFDMSENGLLPYAEVDVDNKFFMPNGRV